MTVAAPRFSIVTPVFDPPARALEEMIDSVRSQTFGDWELILVDDRSTQAHVLPILRGAAEADARIRVIERADNGHIVRASNDGIEAARGEFVVLVDHDDLLVDVALERMAAAIDAEPEADYLYSDEDKVDDDGNLYDRFRKPDWSPERLRGQMYTSHLSVLRTSLVREVGGFHEGFDGSQDHDLVLRVTERARRVVHVPEVLYHWRVVPGSAAGDPEAKPYAWTAGKNAVQAHLERCGIDATADYGPVPGTYTVERHARPDGLVSVIIPTRGGEGIVWGERRVFVVEAVRSLLRHAGDVDLEVVVVYDGVTPPAVLDELRAVAGEKLLLVRYDKPFNYSEKCNIGALRSHGRWLVMLNDDVEVVTPRFVQRLVAPLLEEGVGMTGARLLFPDGTLQHAGVVYRRGDPGHAYYGDFDDELGVANALVLDRECSALTGACMAMSRKVFDQVGGFSELLPVNFNDTDLSLKVAACGLRLVWLHAAKAFHFESKTRVAVVHAWEHELLKSRWPSRPRDPYMPAERAV
ncbi:glycosyltransferase [Isoptericola variabilis]|uniref:Glycosyl transferase family 2 n=1 Tax=Isoptericola variabilis (strain 225) TaxID=743718 RepID=F6FS28_ISOV2|nr:glycosyltransferase [Isoptericola variabilis]AEG45125.1 glycosyl transferase family 2 [Isoptericola variabilis 225]TWH32233.1 GT2 family glycosyltransferase [Isoptericola variabilis J7]